MLSTLWIWLYWGWVGSEVVIAVITRTRRSEGKVRDRGSMLLLWIVIFTSISASEWVRYNLPAKMFGGAHWLRPLSLAVLVVGLAIRWTAILTLGKSFSVNVAIRESQTVQRTGLYRYVRHPSYLGLVLIQKIPGRRRFVSRLYASYSSPNASRSAASSTCMR